MATSIELKAERNLINPNFEGYKLSLDKLPVYCTQVDNGTYVTALTDEQFSYHHAKLFGVYNHLVQDPWNLNAVYIIDTDWNIRKAVGHDMSVDCGATVYTIPDASNQQFVVGRCNAKLHFLSADLAVVCDGAGQLYIVSTGNRQENGTDAWKCLISRMLPEEKTPCLLIDAVEHSKEENHMIDCLLVHVIESTPEQKDKYRSQYLTVLEWITFTSVDRKVWTLGRTRQLVSRKPFSYACLDREGHSITIAGEAEFVFTQDSELPVVSDEEKEEENSGPRPPDYTWHQTAEDLSVQFTVAEGVTKGDIYLTMSFNRIDFGLKNKSALLKGNLCGEIDTESCTWTIEGRRVDLYLSKKTEGNWPLVVDGDTRGEMLSEPSEVAAIHERLASLTSEEMNPDPEKSEKPYNTQQLEECDMYPDDESVLLTINGDTHKIQYRIGLGSHQWLFNVTMGENSTPGLCLRHDVDGLLWKQDTGDKSRWKHIATFNAFGYVQASKQQRKFTICPPDYSYSAICDNSKHIYLYRQNIPVATPLRNRKTGQQVNAVAKQQVISLDTTNDILGIQTTNERLFILTKDKLFMIKVG
ncbi:nudC domain-containing protein 1-like isoform X1 [Ruditapes philippinarum]|uniref:nudC domain-containing protein 1-like isoform X1 n=1 Tax=Ruditapes philippinarum TaxID=129788 RepID=UPI00295B7E65|nr:nudC domain-containing protein 1-like isoform X1 [Ruditapes philippinarum]